MLLSDRRIPKTQEELVKRIDHTVLKPEEGFQAINRAIEETEKYGFRALVIPPWAVKEAAGISRAKIATVISFPLGHDPIDLKKVQVERAVGDGASEVDVVINIMAALSGRLEYINREIMELTSFAHSMGAGIKFILETGSLNAELIASISKMVAEAGGDFVKTSTGFGSRGASIEDILIIRKAVGEKQGIKASGGIRTGLQALLMFAAGADILGASGSIRIMKEYPQALSEFKV
ncbi:MAG: deoxyribose-phosphate aldolase [Fervidicoccaceae archaeon]|jgi:deoxyribose-phosphate aldolase|uniref:Deoxyribose-phosphate aldolase n=1 Tax=Fervidicoccus fontis TaxID=683846 RepID=A0A7C2YYY2_9CREN|nr:deoxyribose-phosphate aldolase [Fervidicoccus fontis]